MSKVFTRTKRKPPVGQLCDTAKPVVTGRHPRVERCGRTATVELKGGGMAWETWVCEECALSLLARPATALLRDEGA